VRRRSRDVLVIGEEQLLGEVELGPLAKPQPAAEAPYGAALAPTLPVARDREPAGIAAVELEAADKGDSARSDFDQLGDEPERRRALAGIDGDQMPEPVGGDARAARMSHASSRPRLAGWSAAVSAGVAAVLVAVATIALQSGGSGPSPPDPHAQRAEGEAPAPRAKARPGPNRRGRAPSEPTRADGDSRAGEPSAPPVVASTTPAVTTAPVPPPAPAPTPAPTPTSAPAQNASQAMVAREFGP
jgi:hypothetical protein